MTKVASDKPIRKKDPSFDDLVEYRSIMFKVAREFYPKLPQAARNWYSLEDMANDVFVRVASGLRRTYKPEKGSLATYIYAVSRNHCKQVIEFHYLAMRRHVSVDPDAIPERRFSDGQHSVRSLHARDAIEALLRYESCPLIRALVAEALCGECDVEIRIRALARDGIIDRLRKTLHAYGISYADFSQIAARA